MQTNPLIIPVLEYLKHADGSVSILDIISELENEKILQSLSELSFEMMSFRKNFLVMNALYTLQRDLVQDGYFLSVSAMSIRLDTVAESSSTALMDQADEKLSDYYLDWVNYHETDQQQVEELLTSFWDRYYAVDKCRQALAKFGLDDSAGWDDIQICYRRLVKQCHPDKGGNHYEFISIREAYEQLKCYFMK